MNGGRDFLRSDLEDAWRAVDAVPGPHLGDRGASLAERNRVFAERLQRFQAVMVPHEAAPPADEAQASAFDDLL